MSESIYLGVFQPTLADTYIDLQIKLEPDDRLYDYSKLYYSVSPFDAFSEEQVICFRIRFKNVFENLRFLIPEKAKQTGYLELRLDGLPYSEGACTVKLVRLIDTEYNDGPSHYARLIAQKEWVRKEVIESENTKRIEVPHYPESLSIELTARCNLICPHCSSHGEARLHTKNNLRNELSLDLLERLAHEVFPHLTLVNLVGRGEPTMVTNKLWSRLVELLAYYRVFMTCVTNGSFIKNRINEEALAIIDTLTFSIDGITKDTFSTNRGGADLDIFFDNVAYFNDLRQKSQLMRQPRLGFSWTIKRNNIAEFPEFIRFIKQFAPDYLYVRHLLVFYQQDQEQSLLNSPELANHFLKEGYDLLRGSNIKLDVPPLINRQ